MDGSERRAIRRPLTRLAAAAVVLGTAALAARDLGDPVARPVPAVGDTVARFLPPGADLDPLRPTPTRGVFRFEGSGGGARWRGEVTARGTLLWLAGGAATSADPPRAVPRTREETAPVETVRLMAFVAADRRPTGPSVERYLDALGNLLFEAPATRPAAAPSAGPRLQDLPPRVATEARRRLGARKPLAIRREIALGNPVHALTWQSPHGRQTVRILADGRTLSLELPADEPVPAPVARALGGAGPIRAVLLFAYRQRAADGATGEPILAGGAGPFPRPFPARR